MKVESMTTDSFNEGVYVYFSKGEENLAQHYTVEEYAKAGLAPAFVARLKELGNKESVIVLEFDQNAEFTEALKNVSLKLYEQNGGKWDDIPLIDNAGKLVQYLFDTVMESDSNMAFITGDDIEDLEAELGEPWDTLAKECIRDMEMYKLDGLIELGDEQIETTAYGNLQTMFRYAE